MSTQPPNTSASSATTRIILLLSLEREPYWDEQYSALVDALSAGATIKRVTKAESAVTFLTNNTPLAVIITDAALAKPSRKFDAIRQKTVDYVRNGGVGVIATHFNSFVTPPNRDRFFSQTWGLSWESGDYHRTTVFLNAESCGGRFSNANLPQQYSQKAVFLKNVANDAALYLPSVDSRTESHVFSPSPVDTQQSPVAFTSIGEGWLGYVGDVNSEEGSDQVILAMCGL